MKVAFFLFLVFIYAPVLVNAQVVVNEIGWAGTKASASDEWIELYNNSNNEINLNNWVLKSKDGAPNMILSGIIPASDFFLIERTSDTTISDIVADFYGSFGKNGNISNNGEDLELLNSSGEIVDKVYFSSGWPAGGAGPDYISMERIDPLKDGSDKENWKSNNSEKTNGKDAVGNIVFGTPRAKNSVNSIKTQITVENLNDNLNENNPQEKENKSNEEAVKIFPRETKIQAYAGRDKIGIAGADIEFRGTVFDLKGEKIDSDKIRYIWNFGDGTWSEGKNVSHIYSFPGTYIAALDTALSEDAALHKILVKIIPNEIIIAGAEPDTSLIKLYNGSSEALNISFWQIASGGQKFVFPKNSFIKEKSYLSISKTISGIEIKNLNKSEINLLYPNGSTAYNFLSNQETEKTEIANVLSAALLKPDFKLLNKIKIQEKLKNLKLSLEKFKMSLRKIKN